VKFRPFGKLLSPESALRRLLRECRPIQRTEELPLDAAVDRVAAVRVRASRPVPESDRAAWDGYALRARDVASASLSSPVRLRLAGERFAEESGSQRIGPGEAWAVATGAVLPVGADTVAIFEEVELEGDRIVVRRSVAPGERIRRAGEEIAPGQRLISLGRVLTPADLGALATMGQTTVRVRARPRIGILPNGNELVPLGGRLAPGQIYESNSTSLAALVRVAGGEPVVFAPAPDKLAALRRALHRAARSCDLLLVTGGSSVGERDLLPELFASEGRLLFHGIAVRPGKPTLASKVDGRLWIGLPGHPVSGLLNMYWLGLPLLRRLAGRPGPGWIEGWATMGDRAVALTEGLSTVLPLRVGRDGRVRSTFRSSSAITSLLGARAYTLLPPGRRRVARGDRIRARFLLPPLGAGMPPPNG
jgi:molybdopterin molybdotransferase